MGPGRGSGSTIPRGVIGATYHVRVRRILKEDENVTDQALYEAQTKRTATRDGLIGEMSEKARQIVETLAQELPSIWEGITKRVVTRDFPLRAKELGPTGVQELKSAVTELSQGAEEVAESAFSKGRVWSHLGDGTYRGDNYVQVRWSPLSFTTRILSPISVAVEAVVPLLTDRGFGTKWEPAKAGWPLSDKLKDLIVAYQAQHEALLKIDEDISKAADVIAKAEADDLWKAT